MSEDSTKRSAVSSHSMQTRTLVTEDGKVDHLPDKQHQTCQLEYNKTMRRRRRRKKQKNVRFPVGYGMERGKMRREPSSKIKDELQRALAETKTS